MPTAYSLFKLPRRSLISTTVAVVTFNSQIISSSENLVVVPLFVKTDKRTVYINTACRTHTVICLRRPWGKHQWWWSLPTRSQHQFLLFLHHWDLKVWKYAFSSFWIIKNKQRRPRQIQQGCISWTSELDRVVRSWVKIITPGLERNLNSAIRA